MKHAIVRVKSIPKFIKSVENFQTYLIHMIRTTPNSVENETSHKLANHEMMGKNNLEGISCITLMSLKN